MPPQPLGSHMTQDERRFWEEHYNVINVLDVLIRLAPPTGERDPKTAKVHDRL